MMGMSLIRMWLLGLLAIVMVAVGGYYGWRWYDTGYQEAKYVAIAIALLGWSFGGRWLLLPFLGMGKLGEPREVRSEEVQRVKRPDGTELRVEFFGRRGAPILVLTHGWEQDSTEWYYVKRDLADRYRLVVWDLPGLGKSTKPANRDFSIEKMARDLEAVVAITGPGPVVLVGHSIGGMIIQTFCRLFADQLGRRVVGLALLNTTYTDPAKTAMFAGLWRALEKPVLVPLSYVTMAISPIVHYMNWQSYLSGSMHLSKRLTGFAGRQTWRQLDFSSWLSAKAPPAVIARGALATFRFDEAATLSGIDVPVLVLAGENDRVTKFEANERIARQVRSGKLLPFRPAGHYALFEHHDAFSNAIGEFAGRCQRLAAPVSAAS